MLTIADLWLPILLSAVAVWIASAIAWMMLPHHKSDFRKLPDEDAAMSAVRKLGVSPGVYFFPHMADCGKSKTDPAVKEKFEKGPHGLLHIRPAQDFTPASMCRNMISIFVVYLVIGVFIAYLATLAGSEAGGVGGLPHSLLPRGSEFMHVFRFTGTAGVLAYCFAALPQDICFGKPGRTMLANLADGIAYGLITGAIFAAMWPGAV